MRLLSVAFALGACLLAKARLAPRKDVFHLPGEFAADVRVPDEFNVSISTPDLKAVKISKHILGNGIKVFILRDPGIVKAGAALSVETGSWRDPEGVSGLAHFTEHMLFMGSQEFPAEGEFDRYISANAGSNNAWTSSDHTLYYFNILPQGLLGALDRLSQFFVAPRFDPSALARERQAVNSEYNMGAMQDRRRLWFVEQDIMRPTHHPFSHFSCGNLTTLSSLDQNSVREWFNKEYDPRGMHLVVYSQEPLEVLEQRVKERFGKIKFNPQWKGPIRADSYGEVIPSTVYGSRVFVEPIKDIQILKMIWQVPPRFGVQGNRAGVVAARVLARGGVGSVHGKLRSEGLALLFSADVDNESADSTFFSVSVELTDKGLSSLQRVQEMVYQGIGTLGRTPLPEYVVEQHNTMSTLNYRWQTRRTDYQLFAETVYALRQESLRSFPQKMLFWEHCPADVADLFLNHLLPNKSITFIQAKSSDRLNVTFDQTEPIVGVRYSMSNISDKELAIFNSAHESFQPDITYIEKSEYMPDPDIQVLQSQDPSITNVSRWEPKPLRLSTVDSNDNAVETSWLASDVEFGTPKIVLKTSIFSPALDMAGDPHKLIIAHLWRRQILETLEPLRVTARIGGYSVSINYHNIPSPRMAIELTGFSSREATTKLLKEVYEAIRGPHISAALLLTDIDDLRLDYQNEEVDELYKQTSAVLQQWAFNSTIHIPAKIAIAEIDRMRSDKLWIAKAQEEIWDMIHQVFSDGGQGFHEFTLLTGNIEEPDIKAYQSVRKNSLLRPTLPYPTLQLDVFRPSFSAKTDRPTLLHKSLPKIEAGRSAVRMIVPTGNISDPVGNAFTDIVNAICPGPFFATLRTREQLGYAVGSFKFSLRGENYQGFVVQTEKLNGTATLGRIQNWIQNWIVTGLGEKDEYLEIDGDDQTASPFADHFDRIKAGVVAEWESKHPSLGAKTDEQESALLWFRDNPEMYDQILDAIQNMSREQFRSLIGTYFGANQDWRAVVLDGSAGIETSNDVSLDGWDVVSEDSLDAEDGA